MGEKIVLAIISGLVFPMIFEVWRDRRKRIEASAGSTQPAGGKILAHAAGHRSINAIGSFWLFLCSGRRSVSDESRSSNIEFGSDLCVIFIVLFSIVSWFFLSSVVR